MAQYSGNLTFNETLVGIIFFQQKSKNKTSTKIVQNQLKMVQKMIGKMFI